MADDRAKMDQDLAKFRDSAPAMYWALYSGCLEKGFTPDQAMRIVVAFVMKK